LYFILYLNPFIVNLYGFSGSPPNEIFGKAYRVYMENKNPIERDLIIKNDLSP